MTDLNITNITVIDNIICKYKQQLEKCDDVDRVIKSITKINHLDNKSKIYNLLDNPYIENELDDMGAHNCRMCGNISKKIKAHKEKRNKYVKLLKLKLNETQIIITNKIIEELDDDIEKLQNKIKQYNKESQIYYDIIMLKNKLEKL